MNATHARTAGMCAAVAAAAMGVIVYLAFIFPKALVLWQGEARALSTAQQWMAHASGICTAYGFVLLPVAMLAFLGSLAWLVVAASHNWGRHRASIPATSRS